MRNPNSTGMIYRAPCFLKRFIMHTQSSSTSRYKMLLFNSAESHETDEFKQLALDHNIILFCYPSHLTHLIQPLDVGCFQSYKHWHDGAVYSTVRPLTIKGLL
jgi:hypothetical protein